MDLEEETVTIRCGAYYAAVQPLMCYRRRRLQHWMRRDLRMAGWLHQTVLTPFTRRRLPGEDLSVREVRISCPDATGLGVDIARMLLDFGLRVLKGDISTDGKWCFLIFRVALSSGA